MSNETRTDIDAAPPGYVGLTEPAWKRRARNWKRAAHAHRDLFHAVDGNRIAAEREIERLNTRIAELEEALRKALRQWEWYASAERASDIYLATDEEANLFRRVRKVLDNE